MSYCINIKHPDYIKLLEQAKNIGLDEVILKAKIATWIEQNKDLDRLPTLNELLNPASLNRDSIRNSQGNTLTLFKGKTGKLNIDGSKRTAHKVDGLFFTQDNNSAKRYGDVEEFNLDTTGLTTETIKISTNLSLEEYRRQESEAINKSNADIIYLETVDAKGKETQIILKNKALDRYNNETIQYNSKGEVLSPNGKIQGAYEFSASSNSGKWNSANNELLSLVQNNRKAFAIYKFLIGDVQSFKEIIAFLNEKGIEIEYTERMKRADETMSANEIQSAIDSYNNLVNEKTEDKDQKEKDILSENNLQDEAEYTPQELIEKYPLTGVQKVIWNLIKDVVNKLGIKVKFSSSRITEGFDGSNNPHNGEVLIRPSTLKNGRFAEVLVHEIVHSLTTKIINMVNSGNTKGLTQSQIKAVQGLNKLYNSIKNNNNLKEQYPVKDVFEFIAHLTNEEFVKELESKDKNFIEKIIDFISDILGINNANDLAKKYLKDIISDGSFLQEEGVIVKPSDYIDNQGIKSNEIQLEGQNTNIQFQKNNQDTFSKENNNIYKQSETTQAEIESVLQEFADNLTNRFKVPFKLISKEEAKSIVSSYNNEAGFFDGKTAYIVKGVANKTTAIHEIFTHPFLLQIEKTNPKLYANLLKEAKSNKSIVDWVDNRYVENKDHEYIARAIDLAVQGELDKVKDKNLLDYIKEFFNMLSDELRTLFNIPKVYSSVISPNITLRQLTQFAMYGKGEMDLAPNPQEIEYGFKVVNNITNNFDKVKSWYKQLKDTDTFWNKLQKDLQIPKEQLELLRNSEGNTIEDKLLNFAANYSFVVEVVTAKENQIIRKNNSPLKEGVTNLKYEQKYNNSNNTNKTIENGKQDKELRQKYFNKSNITSTKEILTKISESNHPLNKVAKMLLQFSDQFNIEIELASKEYFKEQEHSNAAGFYDPNENKIYIKEDSYFRGLGSEPTILHEILHSYTYYYLKNNDNKFTQDLEKLYEHAKTFISDEYGLTNLDEFIVALFTDAKFIYKLQQMPAINDIRHKNLFEEIFDHIISLFKVSSKQKSLYEQAFAVATNIITDSVIYNELSDTLLTDESDEVLSDIEANEFLDINNFNTTQSEFERRKDTSYKFLFEEANKYGIKINNGFIKPDRNLLPDESTSEGILGFYNPNNNTVGLTPKFNDLDKLSQTRVLAHEFTHGILEAKLNEMSPSKRNKFIKSLTDYISELQSNDKLKDDPEVKRVLSKISEQGEHGWQELITYALYDPKFAASLNAVIIKGEKNNEMSFWVKLKEIILSVISDDKTMLDSLTDILDVYMNMNPTVESILMDKMESKEIIKKCI